ncbi:MAG: hypothetical protein AAGI66_08710 [Cyanobacteria bacterium P01_H01_bin.74]
MSKRAKSQSESDSWHWFCVNKTFPEKTKCLKQAQDQSMASIDNVGLEINAEETITKLGENTPFQAKRVDGLSSFKKDKADIENKLVNKKLDVPFLVLPAELDETVSEEIMADVVEILNHELEHQLNYLKLMNYLTGELREGIIPALENLKGYFFNGTNPVATANDKKLLELCQYHLFNAGEAGVLRAVQLTTCFDLHEQQRFLAHLQFLYDRYPDNMEVQTKEIESSLFFLEDQIETSVELLSKLLLKDQTQGGEIQFRKKFWFQNSLESLLRFPRKAFQAFRVVKLAALSWVVKKLDPS